MPLSMTFGDAATRARLSVRVQFCIQQSDRVQSSLLLLPYRCPLVLPLYLSRILSLPASAVIVITRLIILSPRLFLRLLWKRL